MVFATAVRLLGSAGGRGRRGPDRVPEGLPALRRGRSPARPPPGWLQDHDAQRLPEPPVALPLALAVLQRDDSRRTTPAATTPTPCESPCSHGARALERAELHAALEARAPRAAGSPARAARALPLRRARATRRSPTRSASSLGKVKTDIHRGREALQAACCGCAHERSTNSNDASSTSCGGCRRRSRPHACCRACWRRWTPGRAGRGTRAPGSPGRSAGRSPRSWRSALLSRVGHSGCCRRPRPPSVVGHDQRRPRAVADAARAAPPLRLRRRRPHVSRVRRVRHGAQLRLHRKG